MRRLLGYTGTKSAQVSLPKVYWRMSGQACYVLISGEVVSAHRVVLPKGGRVGLSALPFQLEDKLCSDLDSVHIATGTIKANQAADVLILSRDLAAYC